MTATAEALLPALRPPTLYAVEPGEPGCPLGGAALLAEHDGLTAAMTRVARELAELPAAPSTALPRQPPSSLTPWGGSRTGLETLSIPLPPG